MGVLDMHPANKDILDSAPHTPEHLELNEYIKTQVKSNRLNDTDPK